MFFQEWKLYARILILAKIKPLFKDLILILAIIICLFVRESASFRASFKFGLLQNENPFRSHLFSNCLICRFYISKSQFHIFPIRAKSFSAAVALIQSRLDCGIIVLSIYIGKKFLDRRISHPTSNVVIVWANSQFNVKPKPGVKSKTEPNRLWN